KVKKIEVESGATLRVSGWGNPSEQQVTRDMLDRFTQVYPDVKINYEPIPDDYTTKLKTQISGGSEPDVFYVDAVLADELIDSNKLLKLNDSMTAAGVNKSDYYDTLINIFSRGEDVYGLPKDFGTLATFYNTALVKSAPKENWNWNDFKAWAAENTSGTDPNSKVYGTMLLPDNARWLAFALANGVKIVKDDNTTDINSPEAIEALDFYYGMVKEGVAAGSAEDLSVGWPGEAFGKERIASALEGGWMVPFLADPQGGYEGVKYTAVALPQSNKGGKGNLLFTNAYSASANSKFPKAAAALVLFLAGPENQGAVLRSGFALPTIKGFEGDAYFNDHPVDAVLFESLDYGTVHYFGKNHGKILDSINNALKSVFSESADSKTALDNAASEINELLK
ncbi:MAG TPA: sugar ABC transporter substrate-binding protein, partial [Chloroflexia bacterium]|nr:sugar ABC transporter substrate-binding protein [Chloroflexia bacterium]